MAGAAISHLFGKLGARSRPGSLPEMSNRYFAGDTAAQLYTSLATISYPASS